MYPLSSNALLGMDFRMIITKAMSKVNSPTGYLAMFSLAFSLQEKQQQQRKKMIEAIPSYWLQPWTFREGCITTRVKN